MDDSVRQQLEAGTATRRTLAEPPRAEGRETLEEIARREDWLIKPSEHQALLAFIEADRRLTDLIKRQVRRIWIGALVLMVLIALFGWETGAWGK